MPHMTCSKHGPYPFVWGRAECWKCNRDNWLYHTMTPKKFADFPPNDPKLWSVGEYEKLKQRIEELELEVKRLSLKYIESKYGK